MYYEEKVINGILFYRTDPDKEWIEMSKEDLTARYIRTKNDNCVYAQLYEGWRDANKELPEEKETDNIWEKGMSDNVLIYMGGSYNIACYHHKAEKWMIPNFCGDWKPDFWMKIVPPAFI